MASDLLVDPEGVLFVQQDIIYLSRKLLIFWRILISKSHFFSYLKPKGGQVFLYVADSSSKEGQCKTWLFQMYILLRYEEVRRPRNKKEKMHF